MKQKVVIWVLVALGLALVVQVLGPLIIGCLIAFALFRAIHSGNPG